jgi:hypothetical protein
VLEVYDPDGKDRIEGSFLMPHRPAKQLVKMSSDERLDIVSRQLRDEGHDRQQILEIEGAFYKNGKARHQQMEAVDRVISENKGPVSPLVAAPKGQSFSTDSRGVLHYRSVETGRFVKTPS